MQCGNTAEARASPCEGADNSGTERCCKETCDKVKAVLAFWPHDLRGKEDASDGRIETCRDARSRAGGKHRFRVHVERACSALGTASDSKERGAVHRPQHAITFGNDSSGTRSVEEHCKFSNHLATFMVGEHLIAQATGALCCNVHIKLARLGDVEPGIVVAHAVTLPHENVARCQPHFTEGAQQTRQLLRLQVCHDLGTQEGCLDELLLLLVDSVALCCLRPPGAEERQHLGHSVGDV
mmetsp:Transcript_33479/g.77794  ORF Transcript_33479/g.77794 Transcript_33479/m.77794 type:complete len:239 (+) Transcript_33479:851-1567(+)